MREILIFCADPSGFYYNPVKKFKWTTTDYSKNDIVVYTDKMVMRPNKIGKVKIAWLFEPEPLNIQTYQYIKNNYNEFDYVFTWDKSLLSISDKFKFFPYGTSWISESDYSIYPKTKHLSMIASSKNQLEGHKLRHNIVNKFNDKFDLFGNGYNRIDSLLTAFKDYKFTIVVENMLTDCNLSEKLITPLLCGTVPIYYGCPSIGDYFDSRGMFTFSTIVELDEILNNIDDITYDSMLPYIQHNFETAKKYQLADDTFYEKLIELKLL